MVSLSFKLIDDDIHRTKKKRKTNSKKKKIAHFHQHQFKIEKLLPMPSQFSTTILRKLRPKRSQLLIKIKNKKKMNISYIPDILDWQLYL